MRDGLFTILLIEDNPSARRRAVRTLRQKFPNATVHEVADKDELNRALCRGEFHLVITDYRLRWSDGISVLRLVKERSPSTPVIMFTSGGDEQVRTAAMREGLFAYVVQAPHYARLAQTVQAALNHAAFGRADHARREGRVRREEDLQRALEGEKRARIEAERASRRKDEALAAVSHELRAPLHAILGWAHFLRRGDRHPDEVRKGLEVIERNARSQARLIDDLLDVSRIASGRLRLDLQRVEPVHVVREVLRSVQPAVGSKNIKLRASLERSAGPVRADPGRLQQVIWNLVTNATKFTPEGGRIEVTLARVGSDVELRVRDSGVGITAGFLPHVFEPFQQFDSSDQSNRSDPSDRSGVSTRREHAGLGLGLATVKNLVELHGGLVSAESEGLGKGATFIVRLPVLAPPGDGAGSGRGLDRAASLGGT